MIPPIGAKVGGNLAKYASSKDLLYANIPLNDGTFLHVLDNFNLKLDNPKLPAMTSFVHTNGDKVISFNSYFGSYSGQRKFIENISQKFANMTTSGKRILEQMLDQFFDHIVLK
ncbi:hypothetical protein IJ596_05400 [bacterium]|nr:hypothetical protein [bacterium]